MQPEHIAKQTAALSACSFLFHWQIIFRKIEVLGPSVSLRLKHFPLTNIPNSINSELSSTQVRCMNRQ